MDKIQVESKIWALEFDIKCLMCGNGEKTNAKHIQALRDSIAKLKAQYADILGTNHE